MLFSYTEEISDACSSWIVCNSEAELWHCYRIFHTRNTVAVSNFTYYEEYFGASQRDLNTGVATF